MKRYSNIFSSVCSTDNIYAAYVKAKKGKSNTYGVILFEKDLDANLTQIQDELLSGIYRTSEYSIFKVYDPKERDVYRLPFKDRVVHHAIMNVLEPIWVSIFTRDSYSCIKGKGIHGVLKKLKKDLEDIDNTQFCLKIDIKKFYPSIDHDVLKMIIRKKIKDKQLLTLLDEIIDSAPGVPIGNYLSQFLANLYLTYFDHWIKEVKKVKYYYRYADDIVILASNKPYLRTLLKDMDKYLSDNLKLKIKQNYQVFPIKSRGIDFVGYKFYHTHILLRKGIKKRLCKKAAKLNKQNLTNEEYKQQICAYTGWAIHCNSKHLLKKVINNEKIY